MDFYYGKNTVCTMISPLSLPSDDSRRNSSLGRAQKYDYKLIVALAVVRDTDCDWHE